MTCAAPQLKIFRRAPQNMTSQSQDTGESTRQTRKGKLDILFADAGIAEPVPTADVTTEHYDKTFGINAGGVYFTVQKALPPRKR